MNEYVEALGDIANALRGIAAGLGSIGFILFLMLFFKDMGGKE